jgi:hypothetical protein
VAAKVRWTASARRRSCKLRSARDTIPLASWTLAFSSCNTHGSTIRAAARAIEIASFPVEPDQLHHSSARTCRNFDYPFAQVLMGQIE